MFICFMVKSGLNYIDWLSNQHTIWTLLLSPHSKQIINKEINDVFTI